VTFKLALYAGAINGGSPSGLVTSCLESAFCSTLFEGRIGRRVEMMGRRRRRHKQLRYVNEEIEDAGS